MKKYQRPTIKEEASAPVEQVDSCTCSGGTTHAPM